MKQSVIAIISILSLTGCLKVLTTHTQVMDNYKNKEAAVARFRQPTEKNQHEGMEEWIYKFGNINNKTTAGETITNSDVSSTYSDG